MGVNKQCNPLNTLYTHLNNINNILMMCFFNGFNGFFYQQRIPLVDLICSKEVVHQAQGVRRNIWVTSTLW